ncbi:capsule assembly Wzi family protein [Algoriphagus yeomjeoni]|uniref:capsule assembly Wzi family protein n=1 Tax=Algoriphagus yeomjeoni TaxID=291403 RepID=UPI003CE587F1
MKRVSLLILIFILTLSYTFAQSLFRDFSVLAENARRAALINGDSNATSIRPSINFDADSLVSFDEVVNLNFGNSEIKVLPLYSISQLNTDRPYGWGDMLMIPNVGFQQYLSAGINLKWKFLNLQIQPEFVWAQNKSYQGLRLALTQLNYLDRYYVWSRGDFPERFGSTSYTKVWWGQSKFTLSFGAFEAGVSTQNIWWGPGQFNSLTFSDNAPGFPHITINTTKPAKTFLGDFEAQVLIGQLSSSNFAASQNDSLNSIYERRIPNDSRYLNAMMVSYQPKWIPNLKLGFGRTFQVYDSLPRNSFYDWLPIFEAFQKERFFENGNTVDFDGNGRDQQVVIFGDFRFPKAQAELYFEYGKRDHAYNWREFILNPEHARAYMIGFLKLFDLPNSGRKIQLRGEITHQQESVNRIIRYSGLGGRNSWHEHAQARGFTNFGQGLGVGTGQGSNVQTFEASVLKGFGKTGVLLERVERDQGFYYRTFYEPNERKPWIDFSLGFLFDKKWNNLLLSSKLQLIHARNYQWQLDPASTPEFPVGENLTSFLAQTSLIYFWNTGKD